MKFSCTAFPWVEHVKSGFLITERRHWEYQQMPLTRHRKIRSKTVLTQQMFEIVSDFLVSETNESIIWRKVKSLKKSLSACSLFFRFPSDPITKARELVNIRIREDTIRELYNSFRKENELKIGFSSFKVLVRHRTQRPQARTDICDLCEALKRLKAFLKRRAATRVQKEELEALTQHRSSAKLQRAAYNTLLKTPDAESCVVTMDFKQNLVLPMLRETPSRFFSANQQVSVLGFVVSFFDGLVRQEKVVMYISEVLNHDFFYVRTCIRDLLLLPFMSRFKTINFFADNAKVFRCSCYFHFLLVENAGLPRSTSISANYFAQHHGKASCDRYFGVMSRYLANASLSFDIPTFRRLYEVLQQWQPSADCRETHEYVVRMLDCFLRSFSVVYSSLPFLILGTIGKHARSPLGSYWYRSTRWRYRFGCWTIMFTVPRCTHCTHTIMSRSRRSAR
jgi:hypothetical protein